MTLIICDKRKQILETTGHALVTGGPGSGKTTVAILKAHRRIEAGLSNGQSVLFLSFSRAAVARVVEGSKQIPKDRRQHFEVQTFHSFFWEILRSHGYLIGTKKRLTLLAPQDEKALSNGIERDESDPAWQSWLRERERLFNVEGRTVFDFFAPKTAELFQKSSRILEIIGKRFPLIIVDEAQDTGPDQWACVKALASHSQILCLADLDQQIFDHLPGIGPQRIQEIKTDLNPLHVDLGSENNRSPDCEIAAFGNDILSGTARGCGYKGISVRNYSPKAAFRDKAIRQAVGQVYQIAKGQPSQTMVSVAMLATYDRGVAIISNALQGGTRPIPHKVLFDEAVTLLSSRFLAFLLEPKTPSNAMVDLAVALDLLATIFRAKGSKTARQHSAQIFQWALLTRQGKVASRAGAYVHLASILKKVQNGTFSGDPMKDWTLLRRMLRESGIPDLVDVDQALEHLVSFNRGKRILSALCSAWEAHGSYFQARKALDSALAEDQLLSGIENFSGIQVMTVHKSKGKQFDAVVVFRCSRTSPFDWPNDRPLYRKSRKILRVAVTRARVHTMILNPAFPECPILSEYRL